MKIDYIFCSKKPTVCISTRCQLCLESTFCAYFPTRLFPAVKSRPMSFVYRVHRHPKYLPSEVFSLGPSYSAGSQKVRWVAWRDFDEFANKPTRRYMILTYAGIRY